MTKQIDINDIVNGLLDHVATQAKELALLKVQLAILAQDDEQVEAPKEEDVD